MHDVWVRVSVHACSFPLFVWMEIGKSRRRPEWDLHSGNPPTMIYENKNPIEKESSRIAGRNSGICNPHKDATSALVVGVINPAIGTKT